MENIIKDTIDTFGDNLTTPLCVAAPQNVDIVTDEAQLPPPPPPEAEKKIKKRSSRAAAAVSAKDECPICCETYNRSLRASIVCSYEDCHYTACKTCVRTYLTRTIQEPHCMNCKKPFDDEFMFKYLNKSYCKTEFRDHRRKTLFDIEVSKIPDTIPAVEKFLKIEDYQNNNIQINIQINELHHEIRKLERTIVANNREVGILRGIKTEEKRKFIMACPNEGCRGFLSTSYKCEICKNYTCSQCLELVGKEKPQRITEDFTTPMAPQNFDFTTPMAPQNFENDAATDADAAEEETDEGNGANRHVCNPDCIKNAETIKKDTRSCPSCGTRIYKIEGCSQIWCTSCHVAFDWNTGRIDNGVIHNPHFFEWQRKGGGAARVAGIGGENAAAAGRGGGRVRENNARLWDNYRRNILDYVDRWFSRLRENTPIEPKDKFILDNIIEKLRLIRNYITRFNNLTRTVRHILMVIMDRDRRKIEGLDNHNDMRILYILKRITDEDFANDIYKKSIQRKKLMEKYHIYELLTTVSGELFNAFYIDELYLTISNEIYYIRTNNEIDNYTSRLLEYYTNKENEIIEFIKYCNEQFNRIGLLYNERVSNILIDKSEYQLVLVKPVSEKEVNIISKENM